ncbi:MAG: 2-octaprenyl-6-methoxyphenyl hydroxylase [Pseudomonadota bacterium]|nr:2-octaprenyl-6-methoxyphenyl hydroxylase [Pseudomonadota bacterium]
MNVPTLRPDSMRRHPDRFDVLIVGGGMVGSSLACALADLPLAVGLVEAMPFGRFGEPGYDDRNTALSYATVNVFKTLGVWSALAPEATPIRHIHVSQKGRMAATRLHADALRVEALGYVVPNRALMAALFERMGRIGNLTLINPARVTKAAQDGDRMRVEVSAGDQIRQLEANLLVIADGTQSPVRSMLQIGVDRRDYGQTAIIANVSTERPHRNWAYERFTEDGPLALLPLGERNALVWTVPSIAAEIVSTMEDTVFLAELERRFSRRLGRFTKVGRRQSYPLVLTQARRMVDGRAVLLGNAAHTIHPVAGQGFNLALREVAILADVLSLAPDVGDKAVLEQFMENCRGHQRALMTFTDALPRLFSAGLPGLAGVRGLGLLGLDLWGGGKAEFARWSMGIGADMPALSRGQAVRSGS